MNRLTAVLLAAALLPAATAPRLHAQDTPSTVPATYDTQRHLIESILGTVVGVLQEATMQHPSGDVSDRLRTMALQLSHATSGFAPPAAGLPPAAPATAPVALTPNDLRDLKALLVDLRHQIRSLRADLADDEATRARFDAIEDGLTDALWILRRLERDAEAPAFAHETAPEAGPAARPHTMTPHPPDDDSAAARPRVDPRWEAPFERFHDVDAFVGDLSYYWPYRATAAYRPIPAIRYNRVEGFVLGIGLPPLDWDDDYDRATLYGQASYGFGRKAWRYEIGAEVRPGPARSHAFGLKLGGAYRRNTTTEDLWKLSWAENSLAAFFFESDYFDYYETEGWTLYAVQRLTPYAQITAGYRSEVHRTLERITGWSFFGIDGNGFRFNPPVSAEGERMNTLVFAAEGGRVAGLRSLPRGLAVRTEAEIGQGLGGAYSFNRYLGDLRLYLPLSPFSSLSLRARGGYATEGTPLQKQFTLGGLGTVRGYPQNAFFGTRMLLANAELAVGRVSLLDDLLDDVQVFGLFDAGWTNGHAGTDAVRLTDVIPSAGFGVGFNDREVRLELAWPLKDIDGNGLAPSLWLRLSPAF
ncbi:hypothetical protein AWN76_016065 [Rhodothermaceae bacterium RA]|nr:hypothetical protein AWN76_016065 [Rhodothermaceae bacterium RA]